MAHIIEIAILSALALCVVGLSVWAARKAAGSREVDQRAALAFEQSLMGMDLTPPPPLAVADRPGFDPPPATPAETAPIHVAPVFNSGTEGPGPMDERSAAVESGTLTESIVGKLTAANLIEGVDGPVTFEAQGPQGTSVRLRGGKRIAILESGFDPADPETDKLLRRFDGVVIAGAGEEPFYVHRFQKFLADRIAF